MTREEEIAVARRHIQSQFTLTVADIGALCQLLDQALDALAREPATEAVLHRKNVRIAALEAALLDADTLHLADEQSVRNMEARLALVREVVAKMPEGDACFACRAALAAVATGPVVEYMPKGDNYRKRLDAARRHMRDDDPTSRSIRPPEHDSGDAAGHGSRRSPRAGRGRA